MNGLGDVCGGGFSLVELPGVMMPQNLVLQPGDPPVKTWLVLIAVAAIFYLVVRSGK